MFKKMFKRRVPTKNEQIALLLDDAWCALMQAANIDKPGNLLESKYMVMADTLNDDSIKLQTEKYKYIKEK